MNNIEKYKLCRKIGMRLNSKIIHACVDRNAMHESGRMLEILNGDVLIFENEEEANVLMDFAMNEIKANNKNIVEFYKEKFGGSDEIEKEIMDALLSSYTSLFKIVSISEDESIIVLDDILNKKQGIKLTDISFSKTAIPGLLIFFRLVPFKDFNMTSGVSFSFDGSLEDYLIRRSRKIGKKIEADSESAKRFVSFFKLNRTDGKEVGYLTVK